MGLYSGSCGWGREFGSPGDWMLLNMFLSSGICWVGFDCSGSLIILLSKGSAGFSGIDMTIGSSGVGSVGWGIDTVFTSIVVGLGVVVVTFSDFELFWLMSFSSISSLKRKL